MKSVKLFLVMAAATLAATCFSPAPNPPSILEIQGYQFHNYLLWAEADAPPIISEKRPGDIVPEPKVGKGGYYGYLGRWHAFGGAPELP